jgi:hypothetical protein
MIKFDAAYVQQFLRERGMELVGEYKDCRAKIEVKCLVCGAVFHKTFDSIKNKAVGCNVCIKKNGWSALRFNYEYVRDFFRSKGCVLLESKYINARQSLHYICSCGDQSVITFDNFKKGVRCAFCKIRRNSGSGHWNWNKDREYIARKKHMNFRCSKLVRRALQAFGKQKIGRTKDILGYTPEQLYDRLKSCDGNFDACSRQWTVDHIFPIKAFVDYGVDDVMIINCLDNLQPLNQSQNSAKGGNYSKDNFELWLKSKGINCVF